ncbi:MAG: glycine cleavage system protein GcvH [Clostridiales bacterium]|nr:glycine cleavage system protein GcvH [Clostridiales bacterium]
MKFTQQHEWVKAEGEIAYMGLSDYAQKALGDIVFVELPRVGDSLIAGQSFGSVESVKAVSELGAPLSGTVTQVNETLEDAPELLNEDPYENWIIQLDISDPGEWDALMDEVAYEEFCKNAH